MSNYIPGFYGDLALAVAPEPGVSVRNDVFFYNADGDGSVRSGLLELETDISLTYNYTTIVYASEQEVLGARWAVGIVPTLGYVDIEADISVAGFSRGVEDDRFGLGDTTVAGNLYWNTDNLHIMWANFVVAPTGRYDEDDLANTGLNYWTLESDVGLTYLNEETGQDYSVVAGYSYNTENEDTNYKSGDEFHVDFALNQFLSDSFALGITGFHYRQLDGDTGEGARLGNFKGEASGIGPAAYYIRSMFDHDVYFILKWIHEFDVENRFKGDYAFASFALTL